VQITVRQLQKNITFPLSSPLAQTTLISRRSYGGGVAWMASCTQRADRTREWESRYYIRVLDTRLVSPLFPDEYAVCWHAGDVV